MACPRLPGADIAMDGNWTWASLVMMLGWLLAVGDLAGSPAASAYTGLLGVVALGQTGDIAQHLSLQY